MVQKLEAIKGGGGSVKVGTTGTISVLMSRELESSASRTADTLTNHTPPPNDTSPTDETSSARLKAKMPPVNEASSSGTTSNANLKVSETTRKKHYLRKTNRIPMLEADNISIDATPIRPKPAKKVEIVDIKCGNPDRTWASPITNRLKKLGFSKLSENAA